MKDKYISYDKFIEILNNSKKMTSEEIIRTYIDFFVAHGHTEVESASLIPKDDPSVLWINAGITPLKKYFDGTIVPQNRRLTSCQKCIRTNDIENDRYIEIWNNVFSQYNAKDGVPREEYEELPSKNIDTGMGVERMACIIQDTPTNYETDLFLPIIEKLEEICDIKYDGQKEFKVIADHVRSLTFALSDGATFENYGRGYVLRRLLRRSVMMSRKLHINRSFMAELVDVVINI